jgi:hypothetical protein
MKFGGNASILFHNDSAQHLSWLIVLVVFVGYPEQDVAKFPGPGAHDGVVGAGDLLHLRAGAHGHHPALHLLGAGAVGLGHHVHLPHRPVVAGREQFLVLHHRVLQELVARPHQQLRQGQVLQPFVLRKAQVLIMSESTDV